MYRMMQRRRGGFGGNDQFTKLLLHCNGADGSTDFPDASRYNKVITPVATAQVDTAQSVFGGASLLVDGNSDYIWAPVDPDWYMGTGLFTIDFRMRINSLAANDAHGILNQYVDQNNMVALYLWVLPAGGHAKQFEFFIYDGGVLTHLNWYTGVAGVSSIQPNTWYHVALIRGWNGNANDWAITVDGTNYGDAGFNGSSADDWPNLNAPLEFGRMQSGAGPTIDYLGDGNPAWLDEIRVSKGIARWTANFTPPSKAYF